MTTTYLGRRGSAYITRCGDGSLVVHHEDKGMGWGRRIARCSSEQEAVASARAVVGSLR